MKILFIGDIVGEPGRKIVFKRLSRLVEEHRVELVIANGENSAGGFGITPQIADELFHEGVHVITGGNHIWDKKEIVEYLHQEGRLLRPANFPDGVPGMGSCVVKSSGGEKVGVLHLMGKVFMLPLNCPFQTARKEIERLRAETRLIVVDMHAEATSEKTAMGWYLDGEVCAVIGTHTHIQTADEQILPRGTAYITDVGMTGPYQSVIGIKKEQVIQKFLTQTPVRFDVAPGPVHLSAVVVDIDPSRARAVGIQRIQMKEVV